jgi:ketosteroid isomerase-like protein
MRKTFAAAVLVMLAGIGMADQHDDDRAAIDVVLDDFHSAAAAADAERYLGHMTDDGVFMGTDEWERWPKHPDFTDYVAMRFANGGWSYHSVEREVQIEGDVAWFDEVVFSETNGRFRGTGVLVRESGDWKIAHYAMSFLILNENWQEVVELTKRTQLEKAEP